MAEKNPKFNKTEECKGEMCDYPKVVHLRNYAQEMEGYDDIDFENDTPPFIPDNKDEEELPKQSVIDFSDKIDMNEITVMYRNAEKEAAFITAQRDIENDDEIDSIRAEALNNYGGFF